MLELDEALGRILDSIKHLPAEAVPVADAHGRFATKIGCAPVDLPLFDNSAMDGYALRSEDTLKARREHPVRLKLIGEIPAGTAPNFRVEPGTCARIFTGSPMPEGADAVVMQEDTAPEGEKKHAVLCFDAVKPWENIRLRGEDLKKGAKFNLQLQPGDIIEVSEKLF